jgi:hypothetical protein
MENEKQLFDALRRDLTVSTIAFALEPNETLNSR